MSANAFLAEPQPAPPLHVPESTSTVNVRVIDSTSKIGIPTKLVVSNPIKGHDNIVCPSYSFLITHGNRHILFDLGVRTDWRKLPSRVVEKVDAGEWTIDAKKGIAEILDDAEEKNVGVKSKDIETVIWSHHHWDHIGDMATFPKNVALLVGPGLIKEYTGKKDSPVVPADYEGRHFSEMDFERDGKGLKIGRCPAIDFFGDGSFYLLNTPGHTIGHICGFARVSSNPDSFVLMGGDASHHCGEFRPTKWRPLPTSITPSPVPKMLAHSCPGEILQRIQRNKRADESFYVPSEGFNQDEQKAIDTIGKLEEFDASDNVLMVLSHDSSLLDQIPLYPKDINDWYEQSLGEKARWLFVKDFSEAIADQKEA